MNARKFTFALFVVVVVLLSACTPAARADLPAAPVAAKPTTAPAAFDMKGALTKYLSNLPTDFSAIQPAALKDQVADGKVQIVDVREPQELAANGFIEGAINIPLRTLLKNLDKLPAKDQPIVLVCGSGHRGAVGMMALQMLGYTSTKSLVGGFAAWKAANMPIVTGKPAEPKQGVAPDVDKDLLAALDKYLSSLPDNFNTVQASMLNDQLSAAKPFVLDVREPKELADNGYVGGSVNIPIRTLIQNLDTLPQDKTGVIVTYCGSGHKGAMAMMALNLLGYTNARNLNGGFGAWKAANLPIAK